ncbi:MAG: hypothetical protein HQL20_07105 [Candidatus Omnitrophica bacterium]|nr:hypothetical protein [Candidatus Omnitrophota bacterium]
MLCKSALGLCIIAGSMFVAFMQAWGQDISGPEPVQQRRLTGLVQLRSGDCMPVLETKNSRCITTAGRTKVYIHRRLTGAAMGQPGEGNGVYLNSGDAPFMTVETDANGRYEVDLPSGAYSVFADDGGKEYCNSFDGAGNACAVAIAEAPVEFNITINHATD